FSTLTSSSLPTTVKLITSFAGSRNDTSWPSSPFSISIGISSIVLVCSISTFTSISLSPEETTPSGKTKSVFTVPDSSILDKSISSVLISSISSNILLVAKISTSSKFASSDFNVKSSGSEPAVEILIGTVLLGLLTEIDTTTFSSSIFALSSLPCPSETLPGTSRFLIGSLRPATSTNTLTIAICSITLLELVIVTFDGSTTGVPSSNPSGTSLVLSISI